MKLFFATETIDTKKWLELQAIWIIFSLSSSVNLSTRLDNYQDSFKLIDMNMEEREVVHLLCSYLPYTSASEKHRIAYEEMGV